MSGDNGFKGQSVVITGAAGGIGSALAHRFGRDGAHIALLDLDRPALEALASGLAEQGIDAEVVNLSSIRPLDRAGIVASLRKTGLALTVEEHSLHGGVGSIVAAITAEEGLGCRVKRLGFAEGRFAVPGPRGEMRARVGIDAPGIIRAAKELLADSA